MSPVPRTQLGGMFGGGSQPLPPQTLDYGAAIQSVFHGASSLLQNAVLRRVAEQNRQFAREQAMQARADRQAQLAIAQQREAREAAAQHETADRAEREFQFKQTEANKPKAHYDATSGKWVYEGQAGQPKPKTAHIDPLSPEGIAAAVERRKREVAVETPAERRGAAAAARADASAKRAEDAAALRDKQAEINAARVQLSVDTQGVPRPSKVPAQTLGKDAKGRTAMVPNPARAAVTRDSLDYERATLQPDRARLRTATSALAPAAPTDTTARPGRLRAPGATGNIDLGVPAAKPRISADQVEYLRTVQKLTDAEIRARYTVP